MSIASSIPAVTDKLIELLTAATWPGTSPTVSDSDPDNEERELVIVGDTFAEGDDDQAWGALGARTRDERYAIKLAVKVIGPGLDIAEARTRAFALFAVVENVLIENVTLNLASTPNLQIVAAELRQPIHRQGILDEGRGCVIESAVRVSTKLRR